MKRPSWDEARRLASEAGRDARLAPVDVPLHDAIGRVTGRDVTAPSEIPHYASSAMDGWLVNGPGPWRVSDGSAAATELLPGHARRVLTGGAVPAHATAVLRDESARVVDGALTSLKPEEPRVGQHIRPAGREAKAGETLLPAGLALNPAHVALAASAGLDTLPVLARPRVDLLVTGDELTDSGSPEAGRVRDGFSVQLPALFALSGAEPGSSRRVADHPRATVEALARATAPLVVTTGGTGTSDADHLRRALATLDARMVFDGVAVRPGGPACLAELPDGRHVLGLPGNPLAAMITMVGIGWPLIAALAGRENPRVVRVSARAVEGRPGVTVVVPCVVDSGVAAATPWIGVSMMRGLASADGLLVVPPGGIGDGDAAEVLTLPW